MRCGGSLEPSIPTVLTAPPAQAREQRLHDRRRAVGEREDRAADARAREGDEVPRAEAWQNGLSTAECVMLCV